ncbi:PspA/IM30 family protein [Gracilibacillus dipsosauri]|uniref:PspA/IM30 family protein n=1 Tax=Gracilibacillus dipsosauri TaxID=178340 RepID=UPI00240A1CEE
MGIFKRIGTILKSNIHSDKNKMIEVQKDMDQLIRELKAKVETAQVQLGRTEQQVLELEKDIAKFTRYEQKATDASMEASFRMQKETAKSKLDHLLIERTELQQKHDNLLKAFQGLQYRQSESMQYLKTMNMEAQTKKKIADLSNEMQSYENQVRRELAEAEALLELRKDTNY